MKIESIKSLIALFALAVVACVFVVIVAVHDISASMAADQPTAIHYQDEIISYSDVVSGGLSIKKYSVASHSEVPEWIYNVRVNGTGQEVSFDTRDEAEEFMVELAIDAGIVLKGGM